MSLREGLLSSTLNSTLSEQERKAAYCYNDSGHHTKSFCQWTMLYVPAGDKQQTGLEVIVNDSLVYSILYSL